MVPEPGVAILGAGRVGSALVRLLARGGVEIVVWWTRSAARARAASARGRSCQDGPLPEALGRATAVIVALADQAVPSMAVELARPGRMAAGAVVFHCGGAIPAAEALAGLAGTGHPRGTFHP